MNNNIINQIAEAKKRECKNLWKGNFDIGRKYQNFIRAREYRLFELLIKKRNSDV